MSRQGCTHRRESRVSLVWVRDRSSVMAQIMEQLVAVYLVDLEEVACGLVCRDGGLVINQSHTTASGLPLNYDLKTGDVERDGVSRSSLVTGLERPVSHRDLGKQRRYVAQEMGEPGENYMKELARQLAFSFHNQYRSLTTWDKRGIVKDIYGEVLLIVDPAFDIVVNIDGLKDKADARNYSVRLATFYRKPQRWPRALPRPEALAEVGFMYLGQEERVHCFSCGIVVSYWEGKDPLREHFTKNSKCTFIQENFVEQVQQLERERPPGDHSIKYANSSARLHSFISWPLGHLATSYQLASVGFFYTGIGTRVQCFSCGLKYEEWKKGDIPLLIHRKLSPLCRFLNTLISKGASPSTPVRPSGPLPPPTHFQSEAAGYSSFSKATSVHHIETPPSSFHHRDEVSTLPDWANEHIRKQSFKHMSRDVPVPSDDCARAGFYLIRKPDVMRCFSCGVMVKAWVDGDIPVEKHREANPHCKFLKEFFPTKLEQQSSDDEGFDPSSLPEPIYVPQDSPNSQSPASPLSSGLSRMHLEPEYTPYSSQYSQPLSLSSHRTNPSYTSEQQAPSYSTNYAPPPHYASQPHSLSPSLPSQRHSLLQPSEHHYSRLTPSYHTMSSAISNQTASPAGSVRQNSSASSYNYHTLSASRPLSMHSTSDQYVGPTGSQYSGPVSGRFIATTSSHQPRDEFVSSPSFGPSSSARHPSSLQVISEEPLFYTSQGKHVRLPPSYQHAFHRAPLSLPPERAKVNPMLLPQNYTVC